MDHCKKWMGALKEAIFKITPNLKLQKLESMKEGIEEFYKTYVEPEVDKDGKLIREIKK